MEIVREELENQQLSNVQNTFDQENTMISSLLDNNHLTYIKNPNATKNSNDQQQQQQQQQEYQSNDKEQLKQFDKVMRGLLSEVDEQRRVFDKKWQMLVQYLMRKQEDQEQTIRRLKNQLKHYQSIQGEKSTTLEQEDTLPSFKARTTTHISSLNTKFITRQLNTSQNSYDSPKLDLGLHSFSQLHTAYHPSQQHQHPPSLSKDEDTTIHNFDSLQNAILKKHAEQSINNNNNSNSNQIDMRQRRFYSLGNKMQNQMLINNLRGNQTYQRSMTGQQQQQQQQQLQSQQIMKLNEVEFIQQLKMKLEQAGRIIKKDQADKIKLIIKLKELKQQLQYQNKDQAANQQKIQYINKQIQTEQITNNDNNISNEKQGNQQIEIQDIGTNTSFEIEQKQIKIVHDPYEENRLKENIAFWKEKVDLLFKEKKESLNTQMAQHRLIRTYENQIEDLKQQLRNQDNVIDSFQMEQRLAETRLSTIENNNGPNLYSNTQDNNFKLNTNTSINESLNTINQQNNFNDPQIIVNDSEQFIPTVLHIKNWLIDGDRSSQTSVDPSQQQNKSQFENLKQIVQYKQYFNSPLQYQSKIIKDKAKSSIKRSFLNPNNQQNKSLSGKKKPIIKNNQINNKSTIMSYKQILQNEEKKKRDPVTKEVYQQQIDTQQSKSRDHSLTQRAVESQIKQQKSSRNIMIENSLRKSQVSLKQNSLFGQRSSVQLQSYRHNLNKIPIKSNFDTKVVQNNYKSKSSNKSALDIVQTIPQAYGKNNKNEVQLQEKVIIQNNKNSDENNNNNKNNSERSSEKLINMIGVEEQMSPMAQAQTILDAFRNSHNVDVSNLQKSIERDKSPNRGSTDQKIYIKSGLKQPQYKSTTQNSASRQLRQNYERMMNNGGNNEQQSHKVIPNHINQFQVYDNNNNNNNSHFNKGSKKNYFSPEN